VMVRGGLSKFQEVCKVSSKIGVASLQVWPRMVYRRSQYVMVRGGLSKFQEVCKVSSKIGVASLQVWPRMVSNW
jgi:hypothetical protein